MAPSIYPDYPPDLTEKRYQNLLRETKDWSIAHGLAVRPPPSFVSTKQDPSGVLATTAPVTLFPSLFPRACFERATAVQQAYNELYSAIARDEEWLEGTVQELLRIDDFIANLWKVHLAVKNEGYVQDLSLGLFRSDYMVHVDPSGPQAGPEIKQVEFNTIASSFGGLSPRVSDLHKYLVSTNAYPESTRSILAPASLPENASIRSLAAGLAAAHTAYGESKASLPLCVLFIVEYAERNVFDQRHLEYALLSNHGIRSFRLPFDEVTMYTELARDRTLIYNPPGLLDTHYEATTIYFRAGYSPSHYRSKNDWDARLELERSAAVKCPSILTQLAGMKKVQQILATPNSPHLARFILDKDKAASILKTFTSIYPLDESEAGKKARALALNPDTAKNYVLKPQREGGGNNVYRTAIPSFLNSIPESHWPAHILMEMIEPPAQHNIILRNGEVQQGGVICELGIFGVCLWKQGKGGEDKGEILENWEAGYLLRTKGDQSEEGGVAAGFGAIDSCCLVDV